ncbi:MAG: hypothetical protein HYS61_03640 [Acidobacteria bacterium]|nr:hypothetical protein [Acidobacteriota bacterium]
MKPATVVTTIFLVLVAILHVLRLVFGVEVTVGGAVVPKWPSVLAILVPSALALGLWREHRSRQPVAV